MVAGEKEIFRKLSVEVVDVSAAGRVAAAATELEKQAFHS